MKGVIFRFECRTSAGIQYSSGDFLFNGAIQTDKAKTLMVQTYEHAGCQGKGKEA